ncbi:N-(5'-phosphoribosyl)anthranilate isomerase [Gordonia hirsuta DSM 44140 = NBRC 16056]|uniref:N-(5'-phosphoribosyl)anthranilate isomerase n=1 Tax=Gordonia hirsuta DSM 44140 = NBRC 16056 TaxID=1121927 RepID=L7LBE6_9ACTN|nr:phosphoribosylanthranilate isomerase [Gordonia hirsuta]GAC58249.1 N-(5'-phosphoribosyl)anthranilate isomerase [Gordonia hirsuta DSM 44140 = NBRC 16056]
MFVKVCGLTTVDDVAVAVEAGADAIGVVINRTSPRAVTPDLARSIIAAADGAVETVLVVNDMPAEDAARLAGRIGATVLQLHGAYTAADFAAARALFPRLWRATSLAHDPDLTVGAYGEQVLLLDAPQPGSGRQWDLGALADTAPSGDWILAGGLRPDNVARAIAQARPWGVDVSSGVESSPGVKDHGKIREFLSSATAVTNLT